MSDFERRLTESMRYGAAQADPAADPMTVVRDRAGRQPRRALVVALVGLLAVLVAGTPAVLRSRQHEPVHGFAPPAAPSLSPWSLSAGLFSDKRGVHPVHPGGTSVQPGGYLYLIVTVSPPNPDGKTYLQQLVGGRWVKLGPHELDQRGVVVYVLRPRSNVITATYRVYVPAAGAHPDAYSASVTVRVVN